MLTVVYVFLHLSSVGEGESKHTILGHGAAFYLDVSQTSYQKNYLHIGHTFAVPAWNLLAALLTAM